MSLPPPSLGTTHNTSLGFTGTLLDPRETNGTESPLSLYRRLSASDDSCVSFRHRKHQWHRDRVLDSFSRLEIDETRQRAYARCGSNAWLVQSDSEHRDFSLRSDCCHDRWCPACAKTRASVIRHNIQPLIENKTARFITLTLKHTNEPLTGRIDRLFRCFTKLRKLKLWKHAVDGGAAFTEVKINEQTMRWHPHIHAIAIGRYLPLDRLKSAWLAITGNSHIVDIRIIKDPGKVAAYVTKYVTKPADNNLYRVPEALDEAIVAMRGRRLVATFGSWRAVALLHWEARDEWRAVLEWPEFMQRIREGNQWCLHAWNNIQTYEHDANDPNPRDDQLNLDWEP
ncbi:MAG: protein rep [candidate division NC10 bacterium]